MKYIIDTHIFIWILVSPEKIPENILEAIKDSEQVIVSNITFWEISLKYSLGKLKLDKITPEELPSIALECGFEILEVDSKIMSTFHKLPRMSHKDPFDRIIIWTAIQKKLTLISRDSSFIDYCNFGLNLLS